MDKLYVVILTWKYGDIRNNIEGIFDDKKQAKSHMKKIAKKFVKTLDGYKLTDLSDEIILEPISDSGSELSDYDEEDVIYNYEITKINSDKIFIKN